MDSAAPRLVRHGRQKAMVTAVALLLVVSKHPSSAQPGGCSPEPPATLTNSVPPIQALYQDLRPMIGSNATDLWVMFSETQVREHGLWCQVGPDSAAGMDSNIGNWYYPSLNGFTLLTNTINDGTPYQSLKCSNQIGLVVDGDVTYYQGIVKCRSFIPNLNRNTIHMAVYADQVYNSYGGPTVDPTMALSVLSPRDSGPNITFELSFNVSFGPPSTIKCTHGSEMSNEILFARGTDKHVSRNVIRSHYVNSLQPDVTSVAVILTQPRVERTYWCEVTAVGHTNDGQEFVIKGQNYTATRVSVAGTPTNVNLNRSTYNSVLVSWTAPSPAPAGYEVFHQTTVGDSSRLSGGNTSNTYLTVTGLSVGGIYSMFVVAFGGADGSPVLPSAKSVASTIHLSWPMLSGSLLVSSSSTSITMSWMRPQFDPDYYILFYPCRLKCDLSNVILKTVNVTGKLYSYTISPLKASSNCILTLTAEYGGTFSNTLSSFINTTLAAPTGAPGGLTGTSVESRSLSVVWGTVPCPHQGGPITGYRLRYSNGTSIVNTTGEGNRQHVLIGLTPFTSYSVQVAAVNDGGTGQYSDPALTVETLQDVPGPVSTLLVTLGAEHAQFSISWAPPLEPNGVIIVYEVCTNISGVFSYTNTSSTQHTLIDLPPSTVVSFSVRAYTIIGPGEYMMSLVSTGNTSLISTVGDEQQNTTPPSAPQSSLDGVLAGLAVVGWVMFTAALVGFIITSLILVSTMRRRSNSSKSMEPSVATTNITATNITATNVVYDEPQLSTMEPMMMTHCAAYSNKHSHINSNNVAMYDEVVLPPCEKK